ncbi:MAG TPA: beta family protein [Candidatus Acidoferrales bacterium]|nr:beta family protein [Candidatus Acidoferrales bacterium]
MAPEPIYVPVLKGKEGEFAALEALTPDIHARLMPLIEVPDVPYDYANDRPSKSLDDHVAGVADRLLRCCHDLPLYIDLPWFQEEDLADGRVALEAILADCANKGLKVLPVISRRSSAKYLAAAGAHAQTGGLGLCVRLLVEDFEEDVDIDSEIKRLLGVCGANENSSDLVIDLEDLGSEASHAVLVARSVFSMIKGHDSWRRIVLAAASFPEDLREVNPERISTLPRREWELWKTLQKRPKLLPRPDIIFGDYAISHPEPTELDPRTMRMSASIRYTTQENWLVVKGRNVRQYGFDQYFDLCKALIKRAEFFGENYSWGDQYIALCAVGQTGPGNATTWRKVGTNHHLTVIVRQIASRRDEL